MEPSGRSEVPATLTWSVLPRGQVWLQRFLGICWIVLGSRWLDDRGAGFWFGLLFLTAGVLTFLATFLWVTGRADQSGVKVLSRTTPWSRVVDVVPDSTRWPQQALLELTTGRRRNTQANWHEHGEALRALHSRVRETR